MPVLDWIGKKDVVNHDASVPFRLLRKVKNVSVGSDSGNLIVHGDNLEALKALMPFYAGKVKCVYIDPPYNTGNENWVYNDRVNSPKIKKWLGKVVGAESEDLCRHDKWLCMMYPRLKLLRDLMRDDGVIFVSIDDNEVHNLRMIMDEIFGEGNFTGNIIWQTTTDNNPSQVSIQHEYIVVYSKKISLQPKWFSKNLAAQLINKKYAELKEKYNNDFSKISKDLKKWITENKTVLRGVAHYSKVDSKGVYYADNPSNPHPGGYNYKIIHPLTHKPCRIPPNGFRWPKETFDSFLIAEDIEFGDDESITPKPKKRLSNSKELLRSVYYEDNRSSTNQLSMLLEKKAFDNPKSPKLISHLLRFVSFKNDIILDSFAGSGTTGHAVLDLNKEDGGNRKFILVEMEDYAKDITAERVKRAINKYDYKDGFDYCELSKPLFNEEGKIDQDCSYEDLATYVFYTETLKNIEKKEIKSPFIGEYQDTQYFLYYTKPGNNTFSRKQLNELPKGKKVIYADNCLVDISLRKKHNVVFKQIPYEVKIY